MEYDSKELIGGPGSYSLKTHDNVYDTTIKSIPSRLRYGFSGFLFCSPLNTAEEQSSLRGSQFLVLKIDHHHHPPGDLFSSVAITKRALP